MLQLSHDTQLLDAGSAKTSCAGLARLLAVPEAAVSISRLGGRDGRLARGAGAGGCSSSSLGLVMVEQPSRSAAGVAQCVLSTEFTARRSSGIWVATTKRRALQSRQLCASCDGRRRRCSAPASLELEWKSSSWPGAWSRCCATEYGRRCSYRARTAFSPERTSEAANQAAAQERGCCGVSNSAFEASEERRDRQPRA